MYLNKTIHKQRDKIKNDEILGSVGVLSTSTGADKKQYEMFCIPFRFVFGWLFSINPKNVAPEAREAVLKYKLECYNVLYNHFTAHAEFYEYKQALVHQKNTELRIIKAEFNTAKNRLDDAKKEFDDIMDLTFEQWDASRKQLRIEFKEEHHGQEG